MKANRGKTARDHSLPDGVEVGQRYLLQFDDPRIADSAYQGRLQQLNRDGLLCFDAPHDLRPKRGTPITIRSLGPRHKGGTFSSEIRGRGRLGGRLPVLLVEPPVKAIDAYCRDTYRVTVCLRGHLQWRQNSRTAARTTAHRCEAVLTNISGGGAQLYLRQQPTSEWVDVSIGVPASFVEEQARRHLPRNGVSTKSLSLTNNPVAEAGQRVLTQFTDMRAKVVSSRLHSRDGRGSVYAVSVAFRETQEGCFHLVRFLERQALRRGVHGADDEATKPASTALIAAA